MQYISFTSYIVSRFFNISNIEPCIPGTNSNGSRSLHTHTYYKKCVGIHDCYSLFVRSLDQFYLFHKKNLEDFLVFLCSEPVKEHWNELSFSLVEFPCETIWVLYFLGVQPFDSFLYWKWSSEIFCVILAQFWNCILLENYSFWPSRKFLYGE